MVTTQPTLPIGVEERRPIDAIAPGPSDNERGVGLLDVNRFELAVARKPGSPVDPSDRATYQNWVEAFARNHHIPIEWAEKKGVRKEDYVLPQQRRMVKNDLYGVYFVFKSMENGPTYRVSVPKYPTKDPSYRIVARQRSRFTHDYFYIRDETLGAMVLRVASFLPFQNRNWHESGSASAKTTMRFLPSTMEAVVDEGNEVAEQLGEQVHGKLRETRS